MARSNARLLHSRFVYEGEKVLSDIRFDASELIQLAREKTQLDDFGALPLGEGLDVLLETYDRNIKDPEGRAKCHARVLTLLMTRLRCEASFKAIPEIGEQLITAPLFVTGLPRSGTSALINLLNASPENRALLQWELHFPDIWPGSEPLQEDPRYKPLADALAAHQDEAFRKMHFVDADTPEECVLLHALAFTGVQLGFEIMLEPYASWIRTQDLRPMYAYQKRLMQMLNWRQPGQQWVLKAPAHMWGIDAIVDVFPDARFVWCHRSPEPVTASINSMNQQVMAMYAGDCQHIDPAVMGHAVMDWYAESLESGLSQRAQLPESLFVDCSQRECAEQPMALVNRIHDAFGMPFSDTSKDALQAHIDANPKGKHGRHEYDLSQFGLTDAAVRERFAFYLNDSRWPLSD